MAKKTLLAGNIASDDDILRYASALDLPTMATPEVQPAKKGGFFESAGSGLSTAFKQIPQLAYGLGAIGAAGIESMVGEGGIATALKQGAVDKYLEWSKKIQADSSENYEWDTAYGKAKEGDIGALVDFLGYGIGYGLGQGAQILASAGVGGAVAKTVGREAVEKMASGMVAKEAAELAAKNAALPAAQRVAAAEINRLAVSNVATKIGQNAAIGASAFGMEGGEIGGDLVAENRDRELTGSELVRALGATALAGGFEFAGDRLGLSALTGKIGFGKSMTGIGGRAVRAGTGAIAAAPGEFATEYMQTGVENWGKGKEDSLLTWQQSEEAQREAINAGALGAVGGGTYGIIGGALSKAQQDQPVVPASVPATASAQTPATPASQPVPSLTDITTAPTVEDAIATFDAIVSAPVSRDEGMFNLADLEPELKQSGILGSVLGMPAFTAAANPTTTSPLPQTPVAMPGALADIAGVSELSALVEQERTDKQARLAAEIARMRQRSQPGEASVVETPETVQAEAQGAQAPAAPAAGAAPAAAGNAGQVIANAGQNAGQVAANAGLAGGNAGQNAGNAGQDSDLHAAPATVAKKETVAPAEQAPQKSDPLPVAADFDSPGKFHAAVREWRARNGSAPVASAPTETPFSKVADLNKKIASAEKRLAANEQKKRTQPLTPPAILNEVSDKIRKQITDLKRERAEIAAPQAPAAPAQSTNAVADTQAAKGEVKEAVGSAQTSARQRLKEIAGRLGVLVSERNGGFHTSGGVVEIPAEDTAVEGAVSADHVFAHELGHAAMQKRGVSFKGFPVAKIKESIPNWDELRAASQAFRPAAWNHANDKIRLHARKPSEIIADAIGLVLLGNADVSLLKPLMDSTGMTARDLGLESAPATNQPAPAVDQAAPAVDQSAPDISTDTKPGKAAQRQDGAADTATGQAPQLYRPAIADFFASLPNYATAEELAEALAKTNFSADDKAAIQRIEAGWVDMLDNLETAKKVTIKC